MKETVGVQFKNNVRLYYFDPCGEKFEQDDYVIVETVRGLELAKIVIPNKFLDDSEVEFELKPVIRKAWKSDLDKQEQHEKMAPKAFETFKKHVKALNLEMKPLYCEYTIDGAKIIFYYCADDRVDFIELLKIIKGEFKARIELRQVGERDAARIIGGLGPCGREICCRTCLTNFDYVTMKMAKDQGLSLNNTKISGSCGKLMCCIGYEHGLYKKLKAELPDVNDIVKTPHSDRAKVVSVDYMKMIIRVKNDIDKDEITAYRSSDVKFLLKDGGDPSVNTQNVVVSEPVNTIPEVVDTPVETNKPKNDKDKNKKIKNIKKFKRNSNGKSN